MKKNIAIVILSIIIVVLIYKVMVPTAVTERRINLRNRYSDTSLNENATQKDTRLTLKNEQREEDDSDYEEGDDEWQEEDNYADNNPPQPEKKTFFDKLNEPIRFPKSDALNQKIDLNKKILVIDDNPPPQKQHWGNGPDTNLNKDDQPDTFSLNLKTCKPYKETMDSEYMGIKIKYEIEILGWINNKCTLNFKSKMTGIDESFKDMYGIDPSDATISAFTSALYLSA